MSKYFKKNHIWSNNTSNSTGLPRPYADVPKIFQKRIKRTKKDGGIFSTDLLELKNDFYLHPRIPIPWQSKPVFDENGIVFNVIKENEKTIFINKICGYCGTGFKDYEELVRWKPQFTIEETNDENGPRVFSDGHPMHLECMKQARIFCPYMRLREESEFEYGTYDILIQKAESWKSIFKNI